jgi:hypothetical protein
MAERDKRGLDIQSKARVLSVVIPFMPSVEWVLVTVLLLLQLSFFSLFSNVSMFLKDYDTDRPWMKLSVATNQERCHVCFFDEEMS